MAQVTNISGIAGVTGAGASSPPAAGAALQQAGSMQEMLLQIANMKRQKKVQEKQEARQAVLDDIALAKQGFSIDTQKFESNAKKAGMSIDLDAALAGSDPDVQTEVERPKDLPAGPTSEPAQPLAAVGAAAAQQPEQSTIEQVFANAPELAEKAAEGAQRRVNTLAQMTSTGRTALATAQVQAETVRMVEGLRQKAANGDMKSMARLIALENPGALNDQTLRGLMVASGSEEESKQAKEFALGAETETQRESRRTSLYTSILNSPSMAERFEDVRDVAKVTDALIAGTPFPSDVRLKPFSPSEQLKILEGAITLKTNTNASWEDSYTASKVTVMGGDGSKTLPASVLSNTQMTIARDKRVELERAKAATAAGAAKYADALFKLEKLKNDKFNARVNFLIDAERTGIDLDETIRNQIINEIAVKAGLTVGEATGFWNWLTGTDFIFKPRLTPEQEKMMAEEEAARKPAATDSLGLGERLGAIKGQIGEALGFGTPEEQSTAQKPRRQ